MRLICDSATILKIDLVVINDAPLSLNYEIIKANYPVFVRDGGRRLILSMRYYPSILIEGTMRRWLLWSS